MSVCTLKIVFWFSNVFSATTKAGYCCYRVYNKVKNIKKKKIVVDRKKIIKILRQMLGFLRGNKDMHLMRDKYDLRYKLIFAVKSYEAKFYIKINQRLRDTYFTKTNVAVE